MNAIYTTVITSFRDALTRGGERIGAFLPSLISCLLILIFGWVVAWVLARIALQLLRTLRVDELAERHGLSRTLSDFGLGVPLSVILSRAAYWLVLLLTLLPAVEALHLTYFTLMVARVLSFIPTLVAAGIILLVSVSIARLLSLALVRTARAANLEYAGALGIVCRYFLSLIVIVIALAQLGVQTAILTVIFAVILISAGLATALALGFGSRAVVANLLAGAFVREHFPEGREVEVQGVRGKIVAVHSVGTMLEGESGVVTVPNTVLMESVVE